MRTITSFGDWTSGTSLITASVSRTDNFVNVNVFNTVTSARILSYRWVLHYFSTIPVGRIKIATIYKRSIFQVEWLIMCKFMYNISTVSSVSVEVVNKIKFRFKTKS